MKGHFVHKSIALVLAAALSLTLMGDTAEAKDVSEPIFDISSMVHDAVRSSA